MSIISKYCRGVNTHVSYLASTSDSLSAVPAVRGNGRRRRRTELPASRPDRYDNTVDVQVWHVCVFFITNPTSLSLKTSCKLSGCKATQFAVAATNQNAVVRAIHVNPVTTFVIQCMAKTGCEPMNLIWLVAATANWLASVQSRSVQMQCGQSRWGYIRWGRFVIWACPLCESVARIISCTNWTCWLEFAVTRLIYYTHLLIGNDEVVVTHVMMTVV